MKCIDGHFVSFLELHKEKTILQEQILSAGKTSEENLKQINDLKREKERLLSELVQSASQKEKEIETIKEVYEGRLKDVTDEAATAGKDVLEASRVNMHVKQQLQEAQAIISEKEHNIAQITSEKASLEADLKKATDTQKKLIEHNQYLSSRLMEIENESASLRVQLKELKAECEIKAHSGDIFTDLGHRILDLELEQEQITVDRNVQLERIDTITERLSNLDVEAERLHREREDVAATRDTQESELAQTVRNLMSVKERMNKNYLMCDMYDVSSVESLEATVSELEAFVESSKMRISDIDERIKEVEEEKSVLMQQQSHALERKNMYVNWWSLSY
jgi:chromosome segregation ATPase